MQAIYKLYKAIIWLYLGYMQAMPTCKLKLDYVGYAQVICKAIPRLYLGDNEIT